MRAIVEDAAVAPMASWVPLPAKDAVSMDARTRPPVRSMRACSRPPASGTIARCHRHESAHPAALRPPLPADSRADQRAGSRAARDRRPDDRPSRPRVRRARQDGVRRHEEGVQDRRRRRHLSGVGNRRVGSGARQHAVARRSRADGRDRPFRGAVEEARRAARPRRRVPAGRLAPWRVARRRSRRGSPPIRSTRSRRCASCTTRRPPASRAGSPTCATRSIAPGIRRSSWSTRSRRWPRSTIATTSGASTSRSRGSQKGLMLPPGLSFNAISAKALAASKTREAAALVLGLERDARDQSERLLSLHAGDQPALRPRRGARHAVRRRASTRCSRATIGWPRRRAARSRAWGLEILCADPALYSSTLTGVMMPEGHNADAFRKVVLDRFDMSLGQGLGKVAGQGLPHRPPRPFQRPDARAARSPASRWASRWPAFRTARAASQAALDYLAETARSVQSPMAAQAVTA